MLYVAFDIGIYIRPEHRIMGKQLCLFYAHVACV